METATLQAQSRRAFTLRQLVNFDGLTCLAMGVVLVLAATPMAELFALPQALLFYAGIVLFPCAALMFFTARRPAAPLVWLVIGGNAAWVVASVVVALWFNPNSLGLAFLVVQAAVVVALLVLELRARTLNH